MVDKVVVNFTYMYNDIMASHGYVHSVIIGQNAGHVDTVEPKIGSHFLHIPLNISVSHFPTGPATEGDDYTSTTQQVVFQSSDSIQYVEIPITDDGVFERTEYFYADLTISAGSGSVGAPNTTTVFITEEGENPPSLILVLVDKCT